MASSAIDGNIIQLVHSHLDARIFHQRSHLHCGDNRDQQMGLYCSGFALISQSCGGNSNGVPNENEEPTSVSII